MSRTSLAFASALVVVFVLVPGGCDSEEDANTLVHACIKRAACEVKGYPAVKHCIDRYVNLDLPAGLGPIYNDLLRCVAGASDCAGVRACFGVGSTCDSSYKASCAGGKAVFCDLLDKTTFTLECGKYSQTCQIKPAGGYTYDATCTGGAAGGDALPTGVDCGDGTCEKTGQSCTPNDDFDRCAGERLETCIEGEWVSFDCKQLNLEVCFQKASFAACVGY